MGHHERFDGGGYPRGVPAARLPIGAQIMCVADCLDAMISDRPYRRGLTHENALATLTAGAGTQWDAQLVGIFQTLVSEPLPEPAPVVT